MSGHAALLRFARRLADLHDQRLRFAGSDEIQRDAFARSETRNNLLEVARLSHWDAIHGDEDVAFPDPGSCCRFAGARSADEHAFLRAERAHWRGPLINFTDGDTQPSPRHFPVGHKHRRNRLDHSRWDCEIDASSARGH